MKEIFAEVARLLEQGEDVAVATVVRTQGSTPREVGAKMIVRRGGGIVGTVGGGCGEAEVWRAALNVIENRRPETVIVDLTHEVSMRSDGVCGGIMEIFVEPWYRQG